ncbi:hypothetical protein BGHDH14_bgh01367 [Blumeria hordei DH14]|uniref:DUF7357 domain-containing protein n=1 Tax=Blumeria graminis f. sp. hordei (strain DH14) TaxID=546991 RepID=N1JCA1_BLUG1|nr:hypothetical protein BGHDH14_bgh01367 [Blumeria hordei DH14]
MRLRISIRRNGLPETFIVWAIDTTSAPTVYQLLEEVNEIIPIESDGEWGLEDYSVELKGVNGANYECLHFQSIAEVMKEDDEILIRCLLTNDVKKRRVSGRTQITPHGVRLFDGVPWGRPLLKEISNRPSINIRPKKVRQSLSNTCSLDDNDNEGSRSSDTSLTVESVSGRNLLAIAPELDESSEDDTDYAPESSEEESSEDEDTEEGDERLIFKGENDKDDDGVDENESMSEPERGGEVFTNNTLSMKPSNIGPNEDLNNKIDICDPASSKNNSHAKFRELHLAFPTSTIDVCKYVLNGTHGDIGEAWEAMSLGFPAKKSRNALLKLCQESLPKLSQEPGSSEKLLSLVKFENSDILRIESQDATEQTEPTESLIEHYDKNGLPLGFISNGKALSFMADVTRDSSKYPDSLYTSSKSTNHTHFTSDCSMPHIYSNVAKPPQNVEEKELVNYDTSEYDGSSSSVETRSKSGTDSLTSISSQNLHYKKKDIKIPSAEGTNDSSNKCRSYDSSDSHDSNDSDNSSESDSSSDSDNNTSDDSSDSFSSEDEIPKKSSSGEVGSFVSSAIKRGNVTVNRPRVAPGAGKKSTQRRNERRRISNAMKRLQEKGLLPAGISKEEFSKANGNSNTKKVEPEARAEACSDDKAPAEPNCSEEFSRRRKALLDSLASGGVEIDQNTSNDQFTSRLDAKINADNLRSSSTIEPTFTMKETGENTCSQPDISSHLNRLETNAPRNGVAARAHEVSGESIPKENISKRRSKLDLDAGRRILFGAMGLKVPKTSEDEEKLRGKISKNIKPLVKKPVDPINNDKNVIEINSEDWRDKIIYRAVECVQEGITLSEPPFPFHQRWDPKQRVGKRKKSQCSLAQFEKDDSLVPNKKQRKTESDPTIEFDVAGVDADSSHQTDLVLSTRLSDTVQIDGDDSFNQERAGDKIACESLEDLPRLPDDMSTLQEFRESDAKPGVVIAFKQLEVSATSRWQPQISAFKTAIITSVKSGTIQATLARRDIDIAEKFYDENGERIYSGFDAIEDEEMEDDGVCELFYTDLIEPKVVRHPEEGAQPI